MTQTEETGSALFLMTADAGMAAELDHWIRSDGWRCDHDHRADSAIDAVRAGAALLLLDDRIAPDIRAEVVAAVRDLPDFAAGTPVLHCAHADTAAMPGCRARIAMPWRGDAVREAIVQWAGPIDAHAMRRDGDPRYRLIRLAGRDAAEPMLARFADALNDMGTQATLIGGGSAGDAHRMAGLAGMLGFAELSALWSAVERAEADAQALSVTLAETHRVARMLSHPG